MYRIYCDGSLLYHSNLESLKILDPSVELELNKTGSFVFTLYPDHPRYSLVKRMKSIIEVWQDDFLLFRGRVLDEDVGWHNEKTFTCEGEMAFLLDTIQRPYDFTGSISDFLGMLLSNHNAQADAEKKFTLGNVTVTDPNDYIVRSDIDYVNTWDVITKKLIDMLGGFLQVRHVDGVNYLDYLKESTLLAPQKITFGKNLLDLKRSRKGEDIATGIIPVGAKLKDAEGNDTDQRLTIESVNGGVDFLMDEDAVNELGTIFKVVIFDDVTDPSNLKTKGEAQLAESVKQWETIDLTAADLATVNKDITSFHLGTQIQVESNPHGLNQRFRVEKLSLKLLDPVSNKITLGKTIKAFSEVIVFQKGDPGKPGQPGIPGKDGKDGRNGIDGVGVASITEQYYLSTSATALSGGSWSGTVPTWVDGRFMWTRSVITYTNGNTVNTNPKCVTGAKGSTGSAGNPGANGKDGVSITKVDVMYYQSTSATTLAGGSWVTTAPAWVNGRFFWEKTVVTYSDGTTAESNPVCVTGQQGQTGATGSPGAAGKDGVGVASITEQYYLSTSATAQSGGSWSDAVPTWVDGRFMWTRSVIAYTSGSTVTTNPKCVTGAKGSTGSAGSPGAAGKDGISITKVDVMYYQSTSATALAGGSWVTTAPAWVNGRFFWEKTVVTYSNGTTAESTPVCITGQQGQTGAAGKDGVGVTSITEQYYLSTSATAQSGGSWSDTVPAWVDGRFMWTRSVITYTSGATVTTNPKCVTGAKGSTGSTGSPGANGKDGISITKVDVMYYQSTSATTLAGGSWVTTAPAWVDGRFFWEKTVVTYSDGSTAESNPVCITGQRGSTGATGATGPKGDTGSPGANGKDAAVHSLTAPSDTSYMWLDISLDPPLLKRYNPETALWVVVNDTTDIVYNLEQNLLATIQVSGQNIQSIVAESYYLKDDTDALISSVSTEIEQTKNSVEIQFNQFSADIEAVATGADAEFEEIRKYIRFEDGKILLGEVGNELELQISNDRISFLQDGAEVAYFSNRKLYVTDTQILHSLQLGSFAFMPRSNGNLSFKKVT